MIKYLFALALLLSGCAAWGFSPATVTPSAVPTQAASATVAPTRTAKPTETQTAIPSPTLATCVVSDTRGDVLNIRKAPGMDAEIIGGLIEGTRVTVIEQRGEWLRIKPGWIAKRYCK